MKQFFTVVAAATAVSAAPSVVQDLLGALSSGANAIQTGVAGAISDASSAIHSGVAQATGEAGGFGNDILGDLNGLLATPTADSNDINIPLPPLVTGIPGINLPTSLFIPLPNDFDPAKHNGSLTKLPDLNDIPIPKIPSLPLSGDELKEVEEGDRFRFTIIMHPKSVNVTIAPEAGSANGTATNGTAPTAASANGTNTTVAARNTSTESGSGSVYVNKPGEKKIGFWEVNAAPKMASAVAPRPIDLAALSFDVETLLLQPELWLFTQEVTDNYTSGFDAAKYKTELEDYFKSKKFDFGNNTNITTDIFKAVGDFINETITQINETVSLWEGVHVNSKMKAIMTFVNGTNSAHQAVRIIGLEKPPTVGADGTVSWTWAVEALLNESLTAGSVENPSIVVTEAFCTRDGHCCQFAACPRYEGNTSPMDTDGGLSFGSGSGPTFETMSGSGPAPTRPAVISDPADAFLGPTATHSGAVAPMPTMT